MAAGARPAPRRAVLAQPWLATAASPLFLRNFIGGNTFPKHQSVATCSPLVF